MYTPSKTRKFEKTVRFLVSEHLHGIIEGPVRVDMLAVASRPKRLMRKKDKDELIYRTTKPDADNVRKAVLDALSDYFDDKQVVSGETISLYASKSGTACIVLRVTDELKGVRSVLESLKLTLPLPSRL